MTDTRPGPWTPDAVFSTLATGAERPAVIVLDGDTVVPVPRADLARLVAGAARLMVENGVGRGDVVCLWAANSARWIAVALAAARIGAVLAPVDVLTPSAEVGRIAGETGAVLVLAGADRAESLDEGLPVAIVESIGPADEGPEPVEPDRDARMALFRTSGTTGKPKMFFLTLGNIGHVVQALVDWRGVGAHDRVMLPLPLHHVYPWITAALPALTIGATLVLPESPSGAHIATAFRKTDPTVLIGVPRLFEAMLDGIDGRVAGMGRPVRWFYAAAEGTAGALMRATAGRIGAFALAPFRRQVARKLRLVVSGGAALKPATADRLETFGWEVHGGYGLSETASAFAGTFIGRKRRGSVGKPLPGCTAAIREPDGNGVGEILASGPSVFSGYLENPEANAGAFTEEGAFRTGDLGYLDADGYLYVTGRAKEVIVLGGGENLYPEDVEAAYLEHAYIAELGVMEQGGALVALVVPDVSALARNGVVDIERAMTVALSSVGKGLPSTWRIADFAVTREPLPRTRIGKIRRFLLPELYEQAKGGSVKREARELTEEEAAWVAGSPRSEVWTCLERAAPERAFDLDSHLQLDLGLDSFSWMTLAVSIEEAVGVRLELADIAEVDTVRDLLERVSAKAGDGAERQALYRERLETDRRWLDPRSGFERAAGATLHAINRVLVKTICGLDVEGAERLPAEGPLLLCPNHASMLDAPALAAAMPAAVRRRAVWAADKTVVFGSPVYRRLCRPARVFPVDPGMPSVALELAGIALEKGGAQVWFAEGWQSPDGRVMPFKRGVARIVETARPMVVPVGIQGTFEAWPREQRLPRPHRLRVAFGEPVNSEDLLSEAGEGEDRLERVAELIRNRVVALGPEAAEPKRSGNGG